ncbi:MAG: hypothetical protein V1753_01905 [Pseudomonadota bacterium]
MIKDSDNNTIEIAGDGNQDYQFSDEGDQGTCVSLKKPMGVWKNNKGYIYIADTEHHCIRRVDMETGIITTVAGTPDTPTSNDNPIGDGGIATSATLNKPRQVWADDAEAVFQIDRL